MYDLAIVGAGVAGVFASLRIAQKHPSCKTIIFDIGKAPGKRRRQLEGWFGSFPFGDGKLYPDNFDQASILIDGRKLRGIKSWLDNYFKFSQEKLIKTNSPSKKLLKIADEINLQCQLKNYYQWKPSQIHKLSHQIATKIESDKINCLFDMEIVEINLKNKIFELKARDGTIFEAKKVLLAVGRSGWRWLKEIYKNFSLKFQDSEIWYGVRAEMPIKSLSEMNKSHCEFYNDEMVIGPFCWGGTIIPEDHADMVISTFRSNEDRWKSDKVSFSILNKLQVKSGIEELERIAKLTYLLSNDRVNKERIKLLFKRESCISLIPEFEYLTSQFKYLEPLFPSLIDRGYFYVPEIKCTPPQIKLTSNLETEIPNLFVAGEATGIFGILSAAITGTHAADIINKNL